MDLITIKTQEREKKPRKYENINKSRDKELTWERIKNKPFTCL